jgi:arginase
MDLAFIVGRGPEQLTNIDRQGPYVLEEDVVQIGQRDHEDVEKYGSQRIEDSAIRCLNLEYIRNHGLAHTIAEAKKVLSKNFNGFWIHFDVDVLADEIMPCVDYRIPGGLQYKEAIALLQSLIILPGFAGMSITIFNPKLDPDGGYTKSLVDCLNGGLLGFA